MVGTHAVPGVDGVVASGPPGTAPPSVSVSVVVIMVMMMHMRRAAGT